MKNKNKYKPPRINKEIKANTDSDNKRFARAKRNKTLKNLRDWSGDRNPRDKTWKRVRKFQNHPSDMRTCDTRREIFVDDWFISYKLEEYFKQHNIPYKSIRIGKRIKKIYRERIYKPEYTTHRIVHYDGTVEEYRSKDKIFYYTKHEYQDATYNYKKLIGYRIIWWYNKDIGIEKLIKSFTHL